MTETEFLCHKSSELINKCGNYKVLLTIHDVMNSITFMTRSLHRCIWKVELCPFSIKGDASSKYIAILPNERPNWIPFQPFSVPTNYLYGPSNWDEYASVWTVLGQYDNYLRLLHQESATISTLLQLINTGAGYYLCFSTKHCWHSTQLCVSHWVLVFWMIAQEIHRVNWCCPGMVTAMIELWPWQDRVRRLSRLQQSV